MENWQCNPDIVYREGGLTNDEKNEIYAKWRKLINMSRSELERFYESSEGKVAGLTPAQANAMGIQNGRKSARWIMKMKATPKSEWTMGMWRWAKRQINFVTRMSGNKGKLYDDKGNKTRKHTSLLIWGHNPEKAENGMFIYDGGGKIKKGQYEIYHETLASTLNELEWYANYLGYEIAETNPFWTLTGGIPYGQTKRVSIEVTKNGKEVNNKMLHASIYRMDSGRYELTVGVYAGGGSTEPENKNVREFLFKHKKNPYLTIYVRTQRNAVILSIENNANVYFPYTVGQLLNIQYKTWACLNNFYVNGKDTCPEKKIFGIRERDIPQGHPLRYMR